MTRKVEETVLRCYNTCERCGQEFQVPCGKTDAVYCRGCATAVKKALQRLSHMDMEDDIRSIVGGTVYGVKLGRGLGQEPYLEAMVVAVDAGYLLVESDNYRISIEDIPKEEADELLD